MAERLRHLPPLTLLLILVLVSLAARVALLAEPCRTPCHSVRAHVLVFDEDYYVNAARVIAGLPLAENTRYASAPSGVDPNAEHPQLAKLIIAGSIELFGDGPFAWRIGSLLFGCLAVAGLFALVRAAGGSAPLALGACTLMVCDNLLLVHGRIATLDIYVVAAMLWGAALYLRGRPIAAGAIIGIGACFKLVGPYVLVVLTGVEALRWLTAPGRQRGRGAGWRALALCTTTAGAVFVGLLALLDRIAPPYDAASAKRITGGPFAHLGHMLSYGATQTSPGGPHGIASYPWQWLVDYKPIVYLNINPSHPSPGLYGIHPAAHFLGMMSPAIMLLALPALALAGRAALLGRATLAYGTRVRATLAGQVPRRAVPDDVPIICLAWFLGTFAPFVALSLIWRRTSYLYYMVVVMPAIYMAVAALVARIPPLLRNVWIVALVGAAVVLYPFTPLP
jgi:hypothetical protein